MTEAFSGGRSLHHRHAGLARRNRFLPPRYAVHRWSGQDPSAMPPLPITTDPFGERIATHAPRLALAYDDASLRLWAEITEEAVVVHPDRAPTDPDFWEQDHIELRLLPDPTRDLDQCQVILAASGKCLVAAGGVECETQTTDRCWALSARLPFASLGLRPPQEGDVITGLMAHTRWGGGYAEIACCTAAQLGYSHAERFAEFVFAGDPPPIALERLASVGPLAAGANNIDVRLRNYSAEPQSGCLLVTAEPPAEIVAPPCVLPPGETTLSVCLTLERPLYTRFRFSFEGSPTGTVELGAVVLRADVPRQPGVDAAALQHPYLLFDAEGLEALRQKARRPGFAAIAAALEPDDSDVPASADIIELASRAAAAFDNWALSGDGRLLRLATRCLAAADNGAVTDLHIDLHTGGLSSRLAMAYDAFQPHLSDAEGDIWRAVLRRFLRLYLRTARARHWNCTAIPNANPVCNGGGGLLALALLEEFPEEAAEALYLARKFIWNWLDYCNGDAGGNTEGAQYWQYGTENFLPFAMALERVVGHDDGLLSHPAIRQHMNMIRVGLCNDGCLHGFNDTIPLPVGGSVAWFCASRYADPFALWYGDHAQRVYRQRRAAGKPTPYKAAGFWSLLVRPDQPECRQQPPLPTAMALPDIEYGILRSGTNFDCALVAGLKGSRAPYTHHNQPDTGSYFIHLRGERLLIDPGYYKAEPQHHSLPIIDGTAPAEPNGYVGRLHCAEAGDRRHLACDATAAYRGAARRVLRHLVLIGARAIVLLDDIVAAEGRPGVVLAQYQCGGATEELVPGRALLIAGQNERLRLHLLTRPDLRLECHPERDLHDTHWGYHFADCRHFPVTGAYQAEESDPLITVFLDASQAEGEPVLERDSERLTVALPGGESIAFRQTPSGWSPEAFTEAEDSP